MARIDGSIFKLFDKIAKAGLLILDDFGLTHLDKQQQMDLMEIIGEATIADAILDRLVHTSHRIELKGKSLRKKNCKFVRIIAFKAKIYGGSASIEYPVCSQTCVVGNRPKPKNKKS
jgi:DNA replication protein DnaC